MRQARPRQIAACVETTTFRQLAALRKLLDQDNGALIARGDQPRRPNATI